MKNNTKKRIAILSNGLVRGGTDTFVVNLVNGLDKNKYDIVIVLSVNGDENTTRVQEVLDSGAEIQRTCALSGLKGRCKHLYRLYKILRKGNYDIFQTNIDLFNGPNMLIAWLAGVKIRDCHSHNTQQERAVGSNSMILKLYQQLMKSLCWKFSNRRTGCSADAMTFLFGNKWKTDRHSLIVNNGINIDSFQCFTDAKIKKQELGLTAKYQILTVGRIVEQKNPLFLEEVFFELCKLRNDCELVWAGTGSMENTLRTQIESHHISEKVHLLGSRSDVNELMQCADIFLLPSIFEGLGIVLIEAQAAGLPCAASDAVPLEANCGGVTYIPLSKSAAEWAARISEMIDNSDRTVIDESRLQQFSIENMVRQMETMFVD